MCHTGGRVKRDCREAMRRIARRTRGRETFAEKLREQSIDTNVTPRKARGVAQKAEK